MSLREAMRTLGIESLSDDKKVKKAYRKMMMKYHPDNCGDDSKAKELNEAYSVVINSLNNGAKGKDKGLSEGKSSGSKGTNVTVRPIEEVLEILKSTEGAEYVGGSTDLAEIEVSVYNNYESLWQTSKEYITVRSIKTKVEFKSGRRRYDIELRVRVSMEIRGKEGTKMRILGKTIEISGEYSMCSNVVEVEEGVYLKINVIE